MITVSLQDLDQVVLKYTNSDETATVSVLVAGLGDRIQIVHGDVVFAVLAATVEE